MKCLCGHVFAIEQKLSQRTSFAVIPDAKYRRFLRLERKVQEAETPEDYLKAIGKNAQLVGSLRTCPECVRLMFVHPGAAKVEYYRRELVEEEPLNVESFPPSDAM